MKKVMNIIIFLILLSIPVATQAIATNASDINYTRIYYFYSDDCKECEIGKEWLENYEKDDYKISVEYIKNDNDLELKVKDTLNIKKDIKPLIIIGSNYFIGFNDKVKNNLTDAISSYEEEEEYCDIIPKLKNNEDVKECINQNKDIYNTSNSSILPKVIIILIGIILISGIVFIIKKKLKS